MAVSAEIVSFNITTAAAGNTVVVNLSSITLSGVTALKFWWSGHTAASNGARITSLRGVGVAVGASSFFCQTTIDPDALGTSTPRQGSATDCCIAEIDAANPPVFVGKADIQSVGATSFTLEILDAFVTDLYVTCEVITGLDNAELVSFTPTGVAPTPQTVTNTGSFQPDVVFFILGAGLDVDSAHMLGAANASGQWVWYGGGNGAATGDYGTYCRAGECMAWHSTSPTIALTNRASFNAFTATGVTVDWLERTNSTTMVALMIKGGVWKVGSGLTQTDTTTGIGSGSLGFALKSCFVVSAGKAATAQDAVPDVHDEWSVGAFTSTTNRAAEDRE